MKIRTADRAVLQHARCGDMSAGLELHGRDLEGTDGGQRDAFGV